MSRFQRISIYIRPYRTGLVAGMVMLTVSNAFGVATPWLLGRAIDELTGSGASLSSIAGFAGLIVGAAVLSGAARFAMRRQFNGISRRIETDLRNDFFDHLLRLDATFYGGTRTGDLMSRATNDTQAVRMAVGPGLMYLANTVVMGGFALALMVAYSGRLTLIALVPLAFLAPVMLYFGRVIHERFERIQDHFGVLAAMVQENLTGVRIVRAYNQEPAQEGEFDGLNAEYLERNMALARTSAVFQPLLTLLMGFGMLVVLWFGGLEVVAGSLSPGDFVAFLFYLGLLGWPIMALGWVINLFQRGAASLQRIETIFGNEPAVDGPAEGSAPELAARSVDRPSRSDRAGSAVEFRDVSFRYPGTERHVLRDVSFRVEAGETLAIVGPTGSGKSTLVALLTRRYDPTCGTVLLDDVPLARWPLEELRDAVALVPQDAFVFSDTIRRNIALGLPIGAKENGSIEGAAEIARLSETVAAFPDGFDTRLGERGVTLSGGQRQRTTLARAIARDAAVLILDDALSAVDTQTETEILRSLRRVFANRTAVVVSHRVSAVMAADLILVLDDGRIVDHGRHDELIGKDGLYTALLRRQLLAEGLEDGPLARPRAGI